MPKGYPGSGDAKNNPVSAPAKETHTEHSSLTQPSEFIIPGLNESLARDPEEIVAIDSPMHANEFDELKFMEERVRIRIEPGREKNSPKLIDVYCNGLAKWIPVGTPFWVERKFVEILARAKPMSIETKHETPDDGVDPANRLLRTINSQFPFSVIQDSPKGHEWFERILAEG